jgi:hypothetical protein
MAHYALLDINNVVTQVIVGKDEDPNENWEVYYSVLFGVECKQTSYNMYGGVHKENKTPFRKNYAGLNYIYDDTRDAFIPPKPYPSWVLNENSCLWEPPVPMPDDGNIYQWNENTLTWDIV